MIPDVECYSSDLRYVTAFDQYSVYHLQKVWDLQIKYIKNGNHDLGAAVEQLLVDIKTELVETQTFR